MYLISEKGYIEPLNYLLELRYNHFNKYTLEEIMNLLRALPLILACAVTLPVNAETSEHKEFYIPPQSISKELVVSSSTKNTTTFKLTIKSLIGTAKDVKITAKVLGKDDIKPIPSTSQLPEITEGKNAALDFILPLTLNQIQEDNLKVQGNIEFLPDYDEMIKNIEANSETTYQNTYLKERLIDTLKSNKNKGLKSVQSIRYIPEKKN